MQRTLYESVYKASSTITERMKNLLAKANEAGTPPEIIARIDEIRINMASFNHTIYLIRKQLWRIKEEKEKELQNSEGQNFTPDRRTGLGFLYIDMYTIKRTL